MEMQIEKIYAKPAAISVLWYSFIFDRPNAFSGYS